jgi:hypothetical protein
VDPVIKDRLHENVLVYDLPNWIFGGLTVVMFVTVLDWLVFILPVAGCAAFTSWSMPTTISLVFTMAAVTVLYGVSVGFLAIGAWATYSEVQGKDDRQSTADKLPAFKNCFDRSQCFPLLFSQHSPIVTKLRLPAPRQEKIPSREDYFGLWGESLRICRRGCDANYPARRGERKPRRSPRLGLGERNGP